MPSSPAIWQRYDDNVAKNATIAIETGTPPVDPNYEPPSLVDDNPARLAMIDSVTGAWTFDFGTAQPLQLASLIHHDFDAGADVKLQGHATNSWGAPSFSASFTIPPWLGTGSRRWPVNPWLDLTEAVGYNPAGFRWWRLVITGNSQNIKLGQVWLSPTIRRLDPDLQWNYVRANTKLMIENTTAWGVKTIYSRGTNIHRLEGDHRMTDAMRLDMHDQWFDVDGRAFPWLLIPDGLDNLAHLVRWAENVRAETHVQGPPATAEGVHDHRFIVEEVARGLRPGN